MYNKGILFGLYKEGISVIWNNKNEPTRKALLLSKIS
jgi:hypothetical protein